MAAVPGNASAIALPKTGFSAITKIINKPPFSYFTLHYTNFLTKCQS